MRAWIVQNNEIVAFDTDLVGSYGICVDIVEPGGLVTAPHGQI